MGDVEAWNERYRKGEHAAAEPDPFLVEIAARISPGRALDLACGAGRHAIHLAERGWEVVAVDGSSVGLAILGSRASAEIAARIQVRAIDLEASLLELAPSSFDLVVDFFYLQRALFPVLAAAVRPGGHFAAAIHVAPAPAHEPHPRRLSPGELESYFPGWNVHIAREHQAGLEKPTLQFLAQRPVNA